MGPMLSDSPDQVQSSGAPRGVPSASTPSYHCSAAPSTPLGFLPTLGAAPGTPQYASGAPLTAAPGTPRRRWVPTSATALPSGAQPPTRQAGSVRSLPEEEQDQQDGEEQECSICLENVQSIYMCIPCGHACLCKRCSRRIVG